MQNQIELKLKCDKRLDRNLEFNDSVLDETKDIRPCIKKKKDMCPHKPETTSMEANSIQLQRGRTVNEGPKVHPFMHSNYQNI